MCQVGKYFYRSLGDVLFRLIWNSGMVFPWVSWPILCILEARETCSISRGSDVRDVHMHSPPLDLTRRHLDIRNSVTLVGGWSTSWSTADSVTRNTNHPNVHLMIQKILESTCTVTIMILFQYYLISRLIDLIENLWNNVARVSIFSLVKYFTNIESHCFVVL